MSSRSEIRTSIADASNGDLADALLDEYDELARRFFLGDFRPSELSGARFSEAAFRICQQVCVASHTAIGSKLPSVDKLLSDLAQVPGTSADDGYRLHIPRTLRLIYDLRNKRDVAHLGSGVVPNYPDASLVMTCASWVLAEFVRLSHQCSIETAQEIVDNLVERSTPMIWEEGDVVRVLRPGMPYRDQVLLILHHFQPQRVSDQNLFEWVEYSRLSAFRRNVLEKLHAEALVDYRDNRARILPPGNRYVDENLRDQVDAY